MNLAHVIFISFLLLTAACQPVTDNDLQQSSIPAVEVLYESQQCGYSQPGPGVTWIDDAQQLETGIKKIQRNMPGSRAINLPKLDFQKEIVLLIEMGQQPTLGYRLELGESDSLTVKQGRFQLMLDWIQRSADSTVAQVVSSPCLLLKLDRGNYNSVQILNRQGIVKATTH